MITNDVIVYIRRILNVLMAETIHSITKEPQNVAGNGIISVQNNSNISDGSKTFVKINIFFKCLYISLSLHCAFCSLFK